MAFSETDPTDDVADGRGSMDSVGDRYEVLETRMTQEELHDVVRAALRGEVQPSAEIQVVRPDTCLTQLDGTRVEIRSRVMPQTTPGTLDHLCPAAERMQVLVSATDQLSEKATIMFDRLVETLALRGERYTLAEESSIVGSMPLVDRYATDEPAFHDWALIFRDHYVENSVGFLLGMERAGMAREWIFALSKGDRTLHRDRVHAWFLHHGYLSDTLDNSVINGSDDDAATAYAQGVNERVDTFIRQAHAAGRKVLVIDDGGLLAQGYGARGVLDQHIDAAVELTVSGLKRIAGAPGELSIPVLNMARSRLKTMLGYNEIADSCMRRLRAILPGEKFIGQHVLLLGFGTLGARMAHYLRVHGCRVSVVDTDILALIAAAEHGYETYTSAADALSCHAPFLVVGTTGELALTPEDLPLLPDGAYLAGFATKDFSLLSEGFPGLRSIEVPLVGVRHTLPTGATVTLLGDGRSLNLFEYEGIANRGYDAYRAGTLIAATTLCREIDRLEPGLHLEPVDRAIDDAGLFSAYYQEYLARGGPGTGRRQPADPPATAVA